MWLALRSGEGLGARLLRGSAAATIVSAAGLPISFATQIILARALGVEDYGVYAFVLATVNILAIYATLGLDNASLRFVSACTGAADWQGVAGFSGFAHRVTALTALILALGSIGIAHLWPTSNHDTRAALAALGVLLPATAVSVLQTCILQATGTVLAAQVPGGLLRPITLISLVAVVLAMAHRRLSSTEVLLLSGAASVFTATLSWYLIRRRCGWAAPRRPSNDDWRQWMRVARSLLGVSTFQMAASQQLGVFALGALRTKRDAGIYSAANQLSLPISIGVGAVLFVAAPMLARYHAQGRRDELQRTLHLSVLAATGFALPALVAFTLLGRWLLGFYGPEFQSGYPILLLLSLTHVIVALGGGIGGYLLSVSGNEKANLRITAVSAAVNLIAVLLLVRHFAMLGVAIAFTLAMAVRSLLIAVHVHRSMALSLVPHPWFHRRHTRTGSP